jgi:hypothetical protein
MPEFSTSSPKGTYGGESFNIFILAYKIYASTNSSLKYQSSSEYLISGFSIIRPMDVIDGEYARRILNLT